MVLEKALLKQINCHKNALQRKIARINIYSAKYLRAQDLSPLSFTKEKLAANNEINRAHKRALWILFKDYDSSFDELLEKSESVKIHVQNLQKLMIEIYKTMNNLNPSYIWEFHEEEVVKYDLRTKKIMSIDDYAKDGGKELFTKMF